MLRGRWIAEGAVEGETLERVPWNRGVVVSWKAQTARLFEAGRLVSFFPLLRRADFMIISPRSVFCVLSFCSPLLLTGVAGAQSGFGGQELISTSADYASSVYATDLDGDGDADVLAATYLNSEIAWYENLGAGTFGAQQLITSAAIGVWSVYATDLDGDGDADVVSASLLDDKIAWYENLGGGAFGAQQVITTDADYARSVYATDLDGDGDADVLSASEWDNKIAWYENLGGGTFGTQQVITTATNNATSAYATDLDGDGDADVLSASWNDDKIAWYENLGGGTFGPQQVITTAADMASSVYATDLDGDGDQDVLSASEGDDKIAWYENLGGGVFGAQQVISTAGDGAYSVYAADLDGDGDPDVLSTSRFDNEVAWYENLGGGTFGGQQVITTAAWNPKSVYATDLDGDGDADVLSASAVWNGVGKIAWYENQINGRFTSLFCNPANTHSGGGSTTLGGSNFSGPSVFHLDAQDGPVDEFGYFLVSATPVDPGVNVSNGELCLAGPIGRYNPSAGPALNSIGRFDAGGVFQNLAGTSSVGSGFDLPATLPSPPGGVITVGATWHFQLWFRDGAGSNLSDGVSVTF